MEVLREKKQKYLREKILDQNYDANQFMDYCQTSIGSIDIDCWTFDQLVKVEIVIHRWQIVHNFINSQKKTPPHPQNVGDNKLVINNDIINEFNQWEAHIKQTSAQKVEEKNKFQLNLLDIDFLQGFSQEKKSGKQVKKMDKNVGVKKMENKNYINVPNDIIKKLQDGNDNFIVAYNPHKIKSNSPSVLPEIKMQQDIKKISPIKQINLVSFEEKREQKKQQKKEQKKQQKKPQFNYISNNNPYIQNFSKILPCKKIINKSLLNGNQDIVISGHQIHNPNIFVPNYVLYFVVVNPQNIQVKRRFKDFQNLRNLLVKFFPTTQIPHLQRCSRLNETEPSIIKKQILFLQSFINNVIMKRELKCKLLQQFLMCKDLDLLKKIFKEYEKLSQPKSLQNLYSISGEIELKINIQNRKYINQQIVFNQFMQDYFIKLKNLYDLLIQSLEQNVKIIGDIENTYKIFKEKIKSTNTQFTPQFKCPNLQKSVERVELMHKQWAASFRTQSRIIQSEIRHLYRYEQDNVLTLWQVIKMEEEITSAFTKRSDKDQAQRDQYQSRKLDQFKTSLESPSKNITYLVVYYRVLKHQVAYFQEKASQEALSYLTQLSMKIDQKFKLFCSLQYSICQDMESVWKNFDGYYH